MADRLGDMTLFLAVLDAGGLAAGGRRLGLSAASVSERIARIEEASGARLLVRTTRSMSLTDEGRLYAEAARNILLEVEDLDARLREGVDQLSGRVRIAAPFDLGRNRLSRIIDDFMTEHPAISIELLLSDGFDNLVTESVDFALRYGTLADSGLMVRRLGDNRRVVCAAPAYLERSGVPVVPEDLSSHDCLIMRFGILWNDVWSFSINGKAIDINIRGRRSANDGDLIRQWALAGHGIALKSIWDVLADIAAGRLVPLLEDYAAAGNAVQIVYPSRRRLPRRTRALMDAIAADFLAPPPFAAVTSRP